MHLTLIWDTQPLPALSGGAIADATLVRMATGADSAARVAAFDALYRRHAERVYDYLRARTANRDDTADLTQQVFLQAFDALPRYRQEGAPFVAWLFRIARNCAVSAQRRAQTTVSWDALPVECHPREADDLVSRALVAQEDRAYLRALLEPLPVETREMLALRFAAGLSAAEIAAVLGKREAAVKKRLSRAMQTLKERSNAIAR